MGDLESAGVSPAALAAMLDILATDRDRHVPAEDVVDLVTSGPDAASANRDTAVVVRDLFAYAHESVWIAGYAVHKGKRVFEALADRMSAHATLRVVLILDIRRGPGDTTLEADLIRDFKRRFRERDWPDSAPLPEMYYFPQAMKIDIRERASLHAKAIVVDGRTCFVTSANFTEAAQNKNIEIGLLVRSSVVAMRLQRHLQTLIEASIVRPI
jgi:phosphatidylserine/phosphatidylglycerophosphate/cardiolipin synthase-like enzyme